MMNCSHPDLTLGLHVPLDVVSAMKQTCREEGVRACVACKRSSTCQLAVRQHRRR